MKWNNRKKCTRIKCIMKRNYLLGIYTITPIVAIQAHRRAWWFREESRLNPLQSYSVEIITLLPFVLTLVEHSSKGAKILSSRANCFSQSLQIRDSGSSWLGEVRREDTWTRSNSTLRVCCKVFSTSATRQMFLSLFHNSHRPLGFTSRASAY